MPRGTRRVGRVALVDFYLPNPPEGWRDWYVYSLGLHDYDCNKFGPEVGEAAREAHSFFFPGYGSRQEPYPHLIGLRPEPLFSILTDIREIRGIHPDNDVSSKFVRLTGAKVSPDDSRAILVSGDSRGYWPTFDPFDVNWDRVHYDEKLLTVDLYREIIREDRFAFLKALGIKIKLPTTI